MSSPLHWRSLLVGILALFVASASTACSPTLTTTLPSCPQMVPILQIYRQHQPKTVSYFVDLGARGGITSYSASGDTETLRGDSITIQVSGQTLKVNGTQITSCTTPAPNATALKGSGITATLFIYSSSSPADVGPTAARWG